MRKITAMTGTIVLFLFITGCNSTDCKNPPDCYQKGLQVLHSGKREQAYKYLAKAAHDDPSNVNYQWAAARVAPNPKFALFHVKTAWDNGLRNRDVFKVYLGLYGATEAAPKLEFALQLYRQLPDSIRTDEVRAEIYFSFKIYDSTIAILHTVFDKNPTSVTCNGLAKAYLARHDNAKVKEFLLKCRGSGLLDTEGYALMHIAYLRDLDFAGCASVFEMVKKEGKYNDELKLIQARGLIAQAKNDDAEILLRQLVAGSNAGSNGELFRNARIALAYTGFKKGNKAAIAAIKDNVTGDTGSARLEKLFYDAIIKRFTDTASLVPVLTDLLHKFPAYPEIQLVLAQELVRSGRNSEAQKVYHNLPDVYLGSPGVIIERARLLDHEGKSSEALAMVSLLHSKKIATKQSLELFRDISLKKNLTDEAMKAQKILERTYKNDVGVRWAKGVMYLKNANYDSAIAVFSALSKDFPKESRFIYARLFAWFNKKDYDRVIRECSDNPSGDVPVLRLLARAYTRRAMPAQADSVYRIAMRADKKDAGIGMEYAEFLMHNKNPGKAAEIYSGLVDKKAGPLSGDSSKATAIALNNLAWSLLQDEGADKETILSAVRKAHEIDKNNSSIIDTYAEALLRFGRYDECIVLLENSETVRKNGDLLVRLADAYEKSGKINKTVRTLQEAEKLFDADQVKKDALRIRIDGLVAEK